MAPVNIQFITVPAFYYDVSNGHVIAMIRKIRCGSDFALKSEPFDKELRSLY